MRRPTEGEQIAIKTMLEELIASGYWIEDQAVAYLSELLQWAKPPRTGDIGW